MKEPDSKLTFGTPPVQGTALYVVGTKIVIEGETYFRFDFFCNREGASAQAEIIPKLERSPDHTCEVIFTAKVDDLPKRIGDVREAFSKVHEGGSINSILSLAVRAD